MEGNGIKKTKYNQPIRSSRDTQDSALWIEDGEDGSEDQEDMEYR